MQRTREGDAKFKNEAYQVFVTMGLKCDSRLPPDHVLARSPASNSVREKCPQILWDLMEAHGGYSEKGWPGVSRGRLVTQLRLWKQKQFGRNSTSSTRLPIESILPVLRQHVPTATALVNAAKTLFATGTVTIARPITKGKLVWGGHESCTKFWGDQREWLINKFAEVTVSNPNDEIFWMMQLKPRQRYAAVVNLIHEVNDMVDDTDCSFWGCQRDNKCTCWAALAWETWDMYVKVFLDAVTEDPSNTITFVSPSKTDTLPGGSADALYNIAGFHVRKALKRSGKTKRVPKRDARACAVFTVSCSVSQQTATKAKLPVDKVVRTQHGPNSLFYVSTPLYAFFYRLELVFWLNLLPHKVAAWTKGKFFDQLMQFASKDASVVKAWQMCVDQMVKEVVQKNEPDCNVQELTSTVTEDAQSIFQMLLETYASTRAKEFSKSYPHQSSAETRPSGFAKFL